MTKRAGLADPAGRRALIRGGAGGLGMTLAAREQLERRAADLPWSGLR